MEALIAPASLSEMRLVLQSGEQSRASSFTTPISPPPGLSTPTEHSQVSVEYRETPADDSSLLGRNNGSVYRRSAAAAWLDTPIEREDGHAHASARSVAE